MEVLVASSSVDAGISCWDIQTGAEQLRYKSCVSPSHGLVCVGRSFLASSQLREAKTASGSIFYWSWTKPQVEVKSFPAEQIGPLAANTEGTYIVGGGLSGDIYLWEVASGKLLRKWNAHYLGVSCLVFSDDDSLLISGSMDGNIRVWSLLMIFDDYRRQQAPFAYEYNFMEHSSRVTDIKVGYGGANADMVSASKDKTCKVWSLSKGKLLRSIVFPSEIEAIVLDPAERVFYAGSSDGNIYVAALHTEIPSSKNHGLYIIGSFPNQSKVNCLEYSTSRNILISGSDDGWVRLWNVSSRKTIGKFRHEKGPVNNIVIVRQPYTCSQTSNRKRGSLLPPLEKYVNSTDDEDTDTKTVINFQKTFGDSMDATYLSSFVVNNQIKELQQQGSASSEMEMERLKHDNKKSVQTIQQWKKMYENLHQFCVNELLEEGAEPCKLVGCSNKG